MARLERAAPIHVAGVRRYLLSPVTAADALVPGSDTRRRLEQPAETAGTGPAETNPRGPDRLSGLTHALDRIERALDGK
jgi:hypothetical protein